MKGNSSSKDNVEKPENQNFIGTHNADTVSTLLELVSNSKSVSSNRATFLTERPQKIDEKIERVRTLKLTNDAIEKDQTLKESTLQKLFRFLSIETAIVFTLAFLQAFGWWGFNLQEWSFRIVIAATIGQITTMLYVAVKHLFPDKNK